MLAENLVVLKDLHLFNAFKNYFFREIKSDFIVLNVKKIINIANFELNLHSATSYFINFSAYCVINSLLINHSNFIMEVFIILELILHTPFLFNFFFFQKKIYYQQKI